MSKLSVIGAKTGYYYQGAYRPDLAPKRGKAAANAPASAVDIQDEGDQEEIESPEQPGPAGPLRADEWRRLFAAVRDLEIADLVERLAEHHGVPVIDMAAPASADEGAA